MSGDFNGDGYPDLIATNQTADNPNSAHIYFGHGDGTFSSPILTTAITGSVSVNSLLHPRQSESHSDMSPATPPTACTHPSPGSAGRCPGTGYAKNCVVTPLSFTA